MWRGYGGDTSVAIVLNGDVMLRESHAVGAYSSPVAYLTPAAFAAEFQKIAENTANEAEYIKTLDREIVKTYAFNMLRFAVLCTKHPGLRIPIQIDIHSASKSAPVPIEIGTCSDANRHTLFRVS
jgi:hypothetical protein